MANETRTLKVGDPAPDFTLRATGNSTFTLSEHRGKNVVLVFFPSAFSGVCSQQMPQVQDSKTRFNDPDTVIAGISVDNSWSQGAVRYIAVRPSFTEIPDTGTCLVALQG